MSFAQMKHDIGADTLSKKDGVYFARQGFFYTSGKTADDFVKKIKEVFPKATIKRKGEVWKDFRGGASVGNQSHWYVEFTIPEKSDVL